MPLATDATSLSIAGKDMMPDDSLTLAGGPIEFVVGGKSFATLGALEPHYLRALVTLLKFRDPKNERKLTSFSFTDFCRLYPIAPDSPQAGEILGFLKDLLRGSMRTVDPQTGQAKELPLFSQATMIERDNP